MKQNALLLVTFSITMIGCASNVTPPTKYSYNVYQYKLNKQDFAKVQKTINGGTKNPALKTLTYDNYWAAVDTLEQESFFSVYTYSNITCKIQQTGALTFNEFDGTCSYSYADKNIHLSLTANQYKKDDIYYTLNLQNSNESTATYSTKYNSNKEYFLFTYQESADNLFFIIDKNTLNIPWNTYSKTPQQYNSLPVNNNH